MTSKPHPKESGSGSTNNVTDDKAKKEELVEARMKMIRKKNEELMKRQKEIEEDRKNADRYSEMAVRKHPENFASGVNKESSTPGMGRGRGRGLMLQEMRKETLKAKQWEAKRRENIQKEEEEMKRKSKPSSSKSRFLADDNRVDMSRTTGRNEHSWGGARFNQVVKRVQREKEGFRSGRGKGNIEMSMSGKERQEYSKWREERARIDEERKARQKKSGNWSRAWDQRKIWDPRKKMWVYENDADDHSFQSTRRQDNSKDWGNDNGNSRRDYRDRGSRHSGGFGRHDERGMQPAEEWGETSGSGGAQEEEEWGVQSTESRVAVQEEVWGETTESRVVQQREDWGENSETEVTQQKTTAGSKTDKVTTSNHQPDGAASGPHLDKHWEGDLSITAENKEGSIDSAKVANDNSYSDAPKPQRELRQSRKQNDSAENNHNNKELASVIEDKPAVDKKDVCESFADEQEPTNVDKDQDKHFEPDTVSVPEKEFLDSKGRNDEQIVVGTDTGDHVQASEHTVDNNQDVVSSNIDPVEVEETSEGTVRHESAAQKANLPKLITKVDKKVSFDTVENESAKETDTQDATSVTIGDIPPTPDFLKLDHGLEWGDIEVDTEDSDVIEPKW